MSVQKGTLPKQRDAAALRWVGARYATRKEACCTGSRRIPSSHRPGAGRLELRLNTAPAPEGGKRVGNYMVLEPHLQKQIVRRLEGAAGTLRAGNGARWRPTRASGNASLFPGFGMH